MDSLQLQLCDIQGRLFELSGREGYKSESFIKNTMSSPVAEGLDSLYNRYQWAGEEYLLEELTETVPGMKMGTPYPQEVLYWTGYLYRYWQIEKGIASAKIVKIAPPAAMKRNYTMFHTMDPLMAIEDLTELHAQKKSANRNGSC